jgi:hypothetical protein
MYYSGPGMDIGILFVCGFIYMVAKIKNYYDKKKKSKWLGRVVYL